MAFLFIHGAILAFWIAATFAIQHSSISFLPASLFVWHAVGLAAFFIPGVSGPGVMAALAGPVSVPYAVFLSVKEWPISGSIVILVSGLVAWLAALRIGKVQSIGVRSLIWNFCFVLFGLVTYLVSYRVFGPFDALQINGPL